MPTTIYKFAVLEDQEWILPDDDEDFEIFFAMDGRVIQDWAPPVMRIVETDEGVEERSYSDFPWLGEHAPILKKPAVDALGPILTRYGQLLPLRGEEVWLFNVTTILDVLDKERSSIVYFDDGTILDIARHVFRRGAIGTAEIFKLPARCFFLLISGHIRVVRTSPEGHQVIARIINQGELFGIAMAMGRTTYPASAIAAVDCVVLAWPNSEWTRFQSLFPSFGANTYRTIGQRLQETQNQVMEMSTEQVEQRIAATLLRLVRQSGKKVAEGIQIDFPITRQDIAEMTGTTLHTVSRLLSGWETKGLVKSERQKVIVVDAHALLLIAENRERR